MIIDVEIQSLEPGEWVELITFDGTDIGAGILRFHNYTQAGVIYWQGNEYAPYPYEATGFDFKSDQPPQPRIVVANIDRSITLLCAFFDDMVGAKIIRHRTLGKFLDAENFGGINPTADPEEHLPDDVWYIERKQSENAQQVTFELSTGANFINAVIPARSILANVCPWVYRGEGCGYAGPPVATVTDVPTTDPLLDRCSKRLSGCWKRFGQNKPLPIGSFPAASLKR